MTDKDDGMDIDMDDDLGLDDDLSDLEADLGLTEPPPTTDAREAVGRALKDSTSGVLNSLGKEDPLDKAHELAKDAIPDTLATEIADASEVYSGIKQHYKDSVKDIKSSVRSTLESVEKVVPEDSVVTNVLSKIKRKLSEEEELSDTPESQAAIQQAQISAQLLETFGEQKSTEEVRSVLDTAMAEKRHLKEKELLANIAVNTSSTHSFNTKITNAYYRRTLELQYKSLFTAKEQLEALKTGVSVSSGQLETLINNTALPDYLKARSTEALKYSLAETGRQQLSELFYSEKNPLHILKTNAIDKMSNVVSSISNGLSSASSLAEEKASIDDMGSIGGSKASMIGSMVGDTIRGKVAKLIGKGVSSTETGEEGIYRVKNAMADLPSYFKDQAELANNEDGFINGTKGKLYSLLQDLSSSDEEETVQFAKQDLDIATAFDNRAHSSIVKIIPNLLSKIYGEVKSIRTNDNDPVSNELVYDHNNNAFHSREEAADTIKQDLTNKLVTGPNHHFESVRAKLSEATGYDIPEADVPDVRAALFMHLLNGGKLNSESLTQPEFITQLPERLREPIREAGTELEQAVRSDPELLDSLNKDIKSIKYTLPNINKELTDLHTAGDNDVAMSLGIMQQDARTKEFTVDQEGVKKLLIEASRDIKQDSVDREHDFRQTVSDNEDEIKAELSEQIDNIRDTLGLGDRLTTDEDTLPEILRPTSIARTRQFVTDTKDNIVNSAEKVKNRVQARLTTTEPDNTLTTRPTISLKDIVDTKLQETTIGQPTYTIPSVTEVVSNEVVKPSIPITSTLGKPVIDNTYLSVNNKPIVQDIPTDSSIVTEPKSNMVRKVDKESTLPTTYKDIELTLLEPEDEAMFRTQFFSSNEYITGAVTSFDAYLSSLGYTRETNLTVLKRYNDQAVEVVKEKLVRKYGDPYAIFRDKIKGILDNKPKATDDELEQEFLSSEEYQSGLVKNLDEWKTALNKESVEEASSKNQYNRINNFFKKTRSLERKLLSKGVKKIFGKREKEYDEDGNVIKSKGLLSRGISAVGSTAKVSGKVLGSMFGIVGNSDDNGYKPVNNTATKTRALERKVLSKIIGKSKEAAGAVKQGLSITNDTVQVSAKTLGSMLGVYGNQNKKKDDKLSNTLELISKKLTPKKPSFNDKDGDGDRDGNWKDRLLSISKKDNSSSVVAGKVEEATKDSNGISKGMGISTVLLGILAAGKAMGVTLEDVKSFAKGMWDGIKGVGTVLGGVWDVLKTIWGGVKSGFNYIKDGFNYIKTLPQSLSLSIRRAIPTVMGGLSDEEYAQEKSILDAKRAGTYIEPSEGSQSDYSDTGDVTDATMAGYAVGGLATAYAGKKVYNGVKRVAGVGKSVYNGGKTIVETGNKVKERIQAKQTKVKTPKSVTTAIEKAKPQAGKIMSMLKRFKSKLIKKFGEKGAAKLLAKLTAKIAARAVPFAGAALLAYDAYSISKYMISDGLDFQSAVSKTILGFDLFKDDDLPTNEDGTPMKIEDGITTDVSPVLQQVKEVTQNNNPSNTSRTVSYQSIDESKTEQVNTIKYKPSIIQPVNSDVDRSVDINRQPSNKAEVKAMLDDVSRKTGVDSATLQTFAAMESGLNPEAKSKTSSASGLFQFLKRTWKDVLNKHGSKYGIPKDTSPFSAEANATMGAEFLKDNANALKSVKSNIEAVDLYLAHFLGAGGAKKFLKADKQAIASKIFPAAAKSNKPIFYNRDGSSRSIGEVYELFNQKVIKKAKNYGIALNQPDSVIPTNNIITKPLHPPLTSTTNVVPVAVKPPTPNVVPVVSKDQGFRTQTEVTTELVKGIRERKEQSRRINVDNVKMGYQKTSEVKLGSIDNTLKQSLDVQTHMASTLNAILKNSSLVDKELKPIKEDKTITQSDRHTTRQYANTTLPAPAVSLERRKY